MKYFLPLENTILIMFTYQQVHKNDDHEDNKHTENEPRSCWLLTPLFSTKNVVEIQFSSHHHACFNDGFPPSMESTNLDKY